MCFFNEVILKQKMVDDWLQTFFILIPKSGNLKIIANWRPIAVLRIFNKLFSRMVFNRIHDTINSQSSGDQCAYRPGFSIEDACFTVECTFVQG